MAIIVEHREDGQRFVLVGTGFGAFLATRPSWFLGNLSPEEESGEVSVVAICEAQGDIGWFDSQKLRGVSIDGEPPSSVLDAE